MDSALESQLLLALKAREQQDGTAFTYDGVNAVGVLGVPSLEAQLAMSGPTEKVSATLTVRRAWFRAPPASRVEAGLSVFNLADAQIRTAVRMLAVPPAAVAGSPARTYFVTGINCDDPLAYEFNLVDRG